MFRKYKQITIVSSEPVGLDLSSLTSLPPSEICSLLMQFCAVRPFSQVCAAALQTFLSTISKLLDVNQPVSPRHNLQFETSQTLQSVIGLGRQCVAFIEQVSWKLVNL